MTTIAPTAEAVRKARAEADRLATEHDAAEQAKQERVTAALAGLAAERYAKHTAAMAALRDSAEAEWLTASANPAATLEQLWQAFVNVKAASARWYVFARNNAAEADQLLGVAVNKIGAELPRPRPAMDAWAGVTFTDALNRVTGLAEQTAIHAEQMVQDKREDDARTKAERA